jgi:ribonuclease D
MTTPDSVVYRYIREPEALEELTQRLAKADRVSLDIEADSLHNYFEKVCLIQLSVAGEHYLVDPLASVDLEKFLSGLADRPLVLHGGDYDLRMLRLSTGFRPRREVFDSMIAAQLLGMEQVGLAALVERFFGVTIGKAGQKSDWSRRPLSAEQLRYAANDTRFLERLADRLGTELSERGRSVWHGESCRAMVEASGNDRPRDPEEAWRIAGSGRLNRRQLAYLREVWRWRDHQARRANMPAFKILGNEQLFELVYWSEAHPGMPLTMGVRLPRNITGGRLSMLEDATARAAGLSEAEWPAFRNRERERPLGGKSKRDFAALRVACARIAKELGIAASTLAPRAALQAIVRSRPGTPADLMRNGGLLRWQAELVWGALEKALTAERNQVG